MDFHPATVAIAACPVSDPALLTALYDNNTSPRNQLDLKALQACSAAAFGSPTLVHERVVVGDTESAWVDVFRPRVGSGPWPAVLFVHGGRWQLNTSRETSFWAQACCDAGLAFVGLNFPTLSDVGLQAQIACVAHAIQNVGVLSESLQLEPGAWALAGHSSGAHLALAALLRHSDIAMPRALLLLGGLYDLAPLRLTAHQAQLRFTEDDAASCSPLQMLLTFAPKDRRRLPPILVAVGEEESSEFIRQSQALHAALVPHAKATWLTLPAAAHFDAALTFNTTDPVSPLLAFITDALIRRPS